MIGVLVDLSVPIATVALYEAGVRGLLLMRAATVALAATATGLFHQILEYVVSIALSDANWDTPPGSGYLTVALSLLAAIVTVVLWWRASRTA